MTGIWIEGNLEQKKAGDLPVFHRGGGFQSGFSGFADSKLRRTRYFFSSVSLVLIPNNALAGQNRTTAVTSATAATTGNMIFQTMLMGAANPMTNSTMPTAKRAKRSIPPTLGFMMASCMRC